jgi:hypothetical protein
MKKRMFVKFQRTASILILVGGVFILFFAVLTFVGSEILEFFIPWFEAILAFMSSYAFPGMALTGWLFTLFFIIVAFIDLLCSYFVYKGNKIFRWIAAIRSSLTALVGAIYVFLAFTGGRIGYMSFIEATAEGFFYFIYYGVIFILLVLSRKASNSGETLGHD